jgi:nucleoside-diphosphate-sugar epimerase
MKIVLTGAGGFIAQNLIKHLLKKDQIKIKAFLNKKTKVIKHKNIKYYIKKIENITSKDLKGYQALFHFASTGAKNFYKNKSFFNEFKNTYEVNVVYTLNLIETAIKSGIKRFLIPGSCFEYGLAGNKKQKLSIKSKLFPKGYYSISKASLYFHIKNLVNKNKTLNFVYLRYFQVYGEGEKLPRLWAQLRYNAKNDLNFTVENGSLVRDFISVDQVCKKTIYFFDRYKKEGLFLKNVGNQKGVKISDFAKKWWKVFEGKKKLIIKNKKTEHIKYLISKN